MRYLFTVILLAGCVHPSEQEVVYYSDGDGYCIPLAIEYSRSTQVSTSDAERVTKGNEKCRSYYGANYCLIKLTKLGSGVWKEVCGIPRYQEIAP